MKQPISDGEKALTLWQESARKDIERAFGVLQAKFKCLSRAIVLRKLETIESLVTCCLIMHNMCVADRIMGGDPRAVYNPANVLVKTRRGEVLVEDAADYDEVIRRRRQDNGERRVATVSKVCARNADEEVLELVSARKQWMKLHDREESARLHLALMEMLGEEYKKHKDNASNKE